MSKFLTALEPYENEKIGQVKQYETIEVKEDKAEDLIETGKFAQKAWQCPRCNEIYTNQKYSRKPPFCQSPNCDSKNLYPLHPEKHNEIGNTLLNNYIFKTRKDSKDIFFCNGGHVFENDTSESLIEEKTKQMLDECKSHMQEEVIKHIRTKTYEPKEKFGLPKEHIAVENGILNLETKELEEFDIEEHFPLAKLPVEYDPDAECPKIKQFINDIFYEQDVKTIQEFVGYTLWKEYPYAKALVLLGGGENGKSTFIELWTKLLGRENISSDSLYKLLTNEHSRVELYGKLANLTAETPDALKNTDAFKKMTGDDLIKGRRLYKEGFKFKNYAKLIFAANELPQTSDYTHAFFRRILLVDCPYRFTKDPNDEYKDADPNLPQSILTDEELSGFLNWALEGLDRLFENQDFTASKTQEEVKSRWVRETDPVKAFIEKHIENSSKHFATRSDIYEAYKDYCSEHDLGAKDQAVLTKNIKSDITSATTYTPELDGKRQKSFKGLKLSEDYDCYNHSLDYHSDDEDGSQEVLTNDEGEKPPYVTDVMGYIQKNYLKEKNSVSKEKFSHNLITRVTQMFENNKGSWFKVKELCEKFDLEEDEMKVLLEGLFEVDKVRKKRASINGEVVGVWGLPKD